MTKPLCRVYRLGTHPYMWPIEPEADVPVIPEARVLPMAHPFIVKEITVRSAKTGEILKHVDPRQWAKYGLEAQP